MLAACAGAGPVQAQHCIPDTLQAMKTKTAVKLDGILDEPCWSACTRISNFT